MNGPGCLGPTCGTLSQANTINGAPNTFTAPSSVPANPTVFVTVASVTDPTKFATATITLFGGSGPPAPMVLNNRSVSSCNVVSSGTVGTCTINFTPVVGSLLDVMTFLPSDPSNTVTGISDPNNDTFTQVSCHAQNTVSAGQVAAFNSFNVKPGTSQLTITLSTNGGGTIPLGLIIRDISNNTTLNTALATCGGSPTATTTPAGPAVSATAGSIVISGIYAGLAGTFNGVTPPPFSTATSTPLQGTGSTDTTATTNGTYSPNWSTSNSPWAGLTESFTAGSSGGITVSVVPPTTTLSIGQSQSFTATVTNDPSLKGVNWSLSGPNCSGAACGSITTGSTITAPVVHDCSGPFSATVTCTVPATVGNLGALEVGFPTLAQSVGSVTDDKGNTWVSGPNCTDTPGGDRVQLWYAPNQIPGSTHIVLHVSGTPSGGGDIFFYDIPGASTTNPLPSANSGCVNNGASTTNQTGPSISTMLPGIVIAGALATNGISSIDLPFTADSGHVAHVLNSAPGTFNPSWHSGSAGTYTSFTAAFVSSQVATGAIQYTAPASVPGAPTFSDTFSSGSLDSSKWQVNPFTTANYVGAGSTYTSTAANCDFTTGMLRIKLQQPTAGTSTGCQLQSKTAFGYGTYVWSIRASTTSTTPNGTGTTQSGQISTGFIIDGPTSITEIDSPEIEGQFPTRIEFTNWLNGANTGAVLFNAPFNPQDGFHTYSFTWTSTSVTYFVDGVQVGVKTTDVPQATAPGFILIDHYGTNSSGFGGVATVGVTRFLYCNSFQYFPPGAGSGNLAVNVTATSITDPTKSGLAAVTVTTGTPIGVTVSPTSTGTNAGGSTIAVTATVQNDSAGVNWTIFQGGTACPTNCGSISASTSASGVPITYTPPATVSSTLSVTLTAASITSPSTTASASILVSPAVGPSTCGAVGCPAFPGAEGAGAVSAGGRGGVVYNITTTSDNGAQPTTTCVANNPDSTTCTLRDCITKTGARTCVFRVCGNFIALNRLQITNPFLTIAGQTTPCTPITLQPASQANCVSGNNPGCGTPFISTHDVIMRYITGNGNANTPTGPDSGTVVVEYASGNVFNVILDQCTVLWWGNKAAVVTNNQVPGVHDITGAQRCLFYEPNSGHPVILEPDTTTGSTVQMVNIDYHHNVAANFSRRWPLINAKSFRWVNNVAYDWGMNDGDFGYLSWGGIQIDAINNIYIDGPETVAKSHLFLFRSNQCGTDASDYTGCGNTPPAPDNNGPPSIYMVGNESHVCTNTRLGCNLRTLNTATNTVNDNGQMLQTFQGWEGGETSGSCPAGDCPITAVPGTPGTSGNWFRSTPLPTETFPITITPTAQLESLLYPTIGNSQRLDCSGNFISNRDPNDQRVISEIIARGHGQMFNGQYTQTPTGTGTPCTESNHDGLPDAWKSRYNLGSAIRGNQTDNASGETYLNEYLNGMVPHP